jgi:hypothetical protein
VQWSSGSIAQASLTVTLVPGFPCVEGFAREAVVPQALCKRGERHVPPEDLRQHVRVGGSRVLAPSALYGEHVVAELIRYDRHESGRAR